MKEFIEELEYNGTVNFIEGYENRINIDYVLERITDIKKDIESYINDRLNFLEGAINHFIDTDEETALKYMYAKQELQAFKKLIEGSNNENNNK